MSEATHRSALFPLVEPWDVDWLDVGQGHRIRYLQSGNKDGHPVLILHGGPASGSSPHHVRFFDPDAYHVVQFDQRGCGQSTPMGERQNNTTDDLILDIERLRTHLGIDRWLVLGGSWGSALGLHYAVRFPAACSGLLLRGVFLASDADLHWYFHEMRHFLPQAWLAFAQAVAVLPKPNDGGAGAATPEEAPAAITLSDYSASQLIEAYRQNLDVVESPDAQSATSAYMQWEHALGSALAPTLPGSDEMALPEPTLEHRLKYRLQVHYLANRCFLPPGGLLDGASQLSAHELPVAIVHGRRDCICRPGNAWHVFNAIKSCRLQFIDNTGHDPFSPEMVEATVAATECFADQGDFSQWASEARMNSGS